MRQKRPPISTIRVRLIVIFFVSALLIIDPIYESLGLWRWVLLGFLSVGFLVNLVLLLVRPASSVRVQDVTRNLDGTFGRRP